MKPEKQRETQQFKEKSCAKGIYIKIFGFFGVLGLDKAELRLYNINCVVGT